MRHRWHSVLFTASVWLFIAGLSPQSVASQDAPAPALPEPEFKNEKGKAAWDSAKEAHVKKDYKTVAAQLRKAYSGAKKKKDKTIVKKWQTAVKYAPVLVQVKLLIEKKQYQACSKKLYQVQSKFAVTPMETDWKALEKQVDDQLYQPLEAFDYKRSGFSEKYGKFYVDDPKIVMKGKRCLLWRNTPDRKAGVLKIKGVPRNWTHFDAIEFYVQSPTAVPVEVFIMTDEVKKPGARGIPPKSAAGQKIQSSFMMNTTLRPSPGRWQRVTLPLRVFKPQGSASFKAVQDFRLQIRGGKKFQIYLDEIRLMRKDPTTKKKSRR